MLTYSEISKILNLDKEKDKNSVEILLNVVESNQKINIEKAKQKIENKVVFIFGAGPSLRNDVIKIKNILNLKNFCTISADGATTCLVENEIYPDFIVTDLDGNIDKIIEANENKSIIVLHAHGDNIENLKKYGKNFKNLILTTQVDVNDNEIYNFGGFTDGDRALFFALNFNPKLVILAGMDFGNIVGEYSKKISGERLKFKLKKLEIGKKIIEERCKDLNNVYDFTSNKSLNLKKITAEEILNLIHK